MSEKKLQAQLVMHFSQRYPSRSGNLIGTFNETVNAAQGSNMLSLGLVKGCSDLIFINNEKRFIGIEVKYPNTRHNLIHVLEQCRFLIENAYCGWFCTSLNQFESITVYEGLSGGIHPNTVRSWCIEKMKSKLGEFSWKDTDDLIFLCNQYESKTKKKMPTVKF